MALSLFLNNLLGDFDNSRQVEAETRAGNRTHPWAKHVTRLFDRLDNYQPRTDLPGVYVLEESYYKTVDGQDKVKPLFFYFGTNADGDVVLESYIVPTDSVGGKIDAVRNDNKEFRVDCTTLKRSSFPPTAYTLNRADGSFSLKQSCTLPNGMQFTLDETISYDSLRVLETIEMNGKNLTGYTTPIIYERLTSVGA